MNQRRVLTGRSIVRGAVSELLKYVYKILAFILILLAVVPTLFALKWALGILEIESHLRTIEEEISATEDTIFTYKYDHFFPRYDIERLVLANFNNTTLEQVVFSPLAEYDRLIANLSDNNLQSIEAIKKLRYQLQFPIVRTFNFSAAEDTEVILVYKFTCFSSDGNPLKEPIKFVVKVNGQIIRPYNESQGKIELNWEKHLSYNEPIIKTRSGHMLYQQTLQLNLLGTGKQGEVLAQHDIKRRLSGDVERCSFDAMIFVRDELSEFEAKGIIPNFLAEPIKKSFD